MWTCRALRRSKSRLPISPGVRAPAPSPWRNSRAARSRSPMAECSDRCCRRPSSILRMHKIQDRAVVIDGQVVVRPMMYIALTYDHRIIDGREAVQFLVTVKQCLEDPARMVLGV